MTTEECLTFLSRHQPMPSDWDITDAEGEAFMATLKHFEEHPDPACLPLFVGAVSKETGLGMYEHITFVILAHPVPAVVTALREGFRGGNDGAKYRCCWWAADVGAWELAEEIAPLVDNVDSDTREAVRAFLDLKSYLGGG